MKKDMLALSTKMNKLKQRAEKLQTKKMERDKQLAEKQQKQVSNSHLYSHTKTITITQSHNQTNIQHTCSCLVNLYESLFSLA
jgi:uncharacterized protein YaiL (DUF2058 family)